MKEKIFKHTTRRQFLTAMAMICVSLTTALLGLPQAESGDRLGRSGQLDLSFGEAGMVPLEAIGSGVSLQTDQQILVVTQSPNQLLRYNSNGAVDVSFGINGALDLALLPFAVAEQPDGKIVLAGEISEYPSGSFAVARVNPDGTLDTTFDDDGMVSTDIVSSLENTFRAGYGSRAQDLIIQPDGSIVLAGSLYYYQYDGWAHAEQSIAFALVRYRADGSLDTDFGEAGVVVTDIMSAEEPFDNPPDAAYGIDLQSDGKIVVAGYTTIADDGGMSDRDFALVRYHANGLLDSSFGIEGVVITDIFGKRDEFRDVALRGDGLITASGFATDLVSNFALVRYHMDGSIDESFGVDGLVITDVSGGDDYIAAMSLQADEKIVAVGWSVYEDPIRTLVTLTRYDDAGKLDKHFGRNGIVVTDTGYSAAHTHDVAIQDDDKIVVIEGAIIRYLP